MSTIRPAILNTLLNEWAWLQVNGKRNEFWQDELLEGEIIQFLSDAHLRIRQSGACGLTDVGLYFYQTGVEYEDGSRFLNASWEVQKDTLQEWLMDFAHEAAEPVEPKWHADNAAAQAEETARIARHEAAFAQRVAEVGHSQAHYEFYCR